MLDAGFSTLDYLKSRLLPDAGTDETAWDAALSKLGVAVVGRMERHCNRFFTRVENDTQSSTARTCNVSLKRYPVEAVASIELFDAGSGAAYTGDNYFEPDSGLISFYNIPGSQTQRLLITYTGGYWLDPMDNETTLPTGATALPADLLELWVSEVQVQAVARGIFGAVALRPDKDTAKTPTPEGLSLDTVEGLRTYRRFSGE